MNSMFSCVTSEHAPKGQQNQKKKQHTEEQQAHENFPYMVRVQTNSQEQRGDF
jgi:hypothetical protein